MKSSLVKMNKENAARCGAAGLRRSAIVERLRLREEWSALKEIPYETETRQNSGTKTRKQQNTNPAPTHKKTVANKIIRRCDKEVSDVLRGTVVLVEVGSEPRALPLRAALSALGASVMPAWSPLVTHVVWTQGGCRSTRAKARALACRLVSPLWVEACAAEGRRLPERIFPVAARPSDLPSPATIRRFLKKAEQENIPLQDLLSESVESDKRPLRLRLSSTDRDTTNDTTNTTNNTTSDTNDTTGESVESDKRPLRLRLSSTDRDTTNDTTNTTNNTTSDTNDTTGESVESDKRPLRLRLSSTDRDTTNTTNNTTSDTNDTTGESVESDKRPLRLRLSSTDRDTTNDTTNTTNNTTSDTNDTTGESVESDKRPLRLRLSSTDRDTTNTTNNTTSDTNDTTGESVESDKRTLRLRLSSTDRDTTNDTTNTTNNTTSDTNDTTDIEARVNTAPRRRAQDPVTKIPAKSKRKLFTQKEPELQTTDEESDNETTAGPKRMQPQRITQRNRKNLAKAERMAKRLVGACRNTQTNVVTQGTQINKPPKIVLTGMSRKERQDAFQAVQQLNGKVQQRVDRRTTHIVMGSCHEPDNTAESPKTPAQTPKTSTRSPKTPAQSPTTRKSPLPMCKNCNSPGTILSKMFSANVTVGDCSSSTNNTNKNDRNLRCRCDCNISGIINLDSTSTQSFDILHKAGENGRVNDILGRGTQNGPQSDDILDPDTENGLNGDLGPERVSQVDSLPPNPTDGHNNLERVNRKPRTLNALLGAARGCRVLRLEWLKDSLKANRWLHHIGYEVRHLKKISRKARVERSALNKMRTEYAYDVFNGMRVRVSPDAEQKDAITQLLTLCGAVIQDGGQPNVEKFQNNKKSGKNVDNLQDGGKTAQNGANGAKITFSHLIARIRNQDGGKSSQNDRQMQDGGTVTADFDLTVGKGKGEVSSKWVFDSVAAARMRTTRRYIND